MKFKERLEKEQNIAYKTLYNSFSNGKISHAYLVSGSKGSPLKETAIFIAKSLICPNDILACEDCINCKKIESGNYADFKFINEKGENILKGDMEDLKNEFNLTAIEKEGKKIYIIHLIEKANNVAINGLLKFIEEPNNEIYGILTTENISKVLPTIVSRCQLIRLKPSSKDEMVEKLSQDYDLETSKILASFNNNVEEINELLEELDVHRIIDEASETFDYLINKPFDLMYYVTKDLENTLDSKKEYKIFFGVLQYIIKNKMFDEKFKKYKNYFNEILNEIMIQEGKLESNMNLNLLIDQLFINILRKGGYM